MKFKHPNDLKVSLDAIETHVDECIRNNDDLNCGIISTQLSNMTKDRTKFEVSVVDVDTSQKPFIMCVYPSVDDLNRLAVPLAKLINKNEPESFCDLWGSIESWCIEIDSRLVNSGDRLCVDTGRQFVAIIMHELGHIKHTHPLLLSMNYRFNKAKSDILYKLVMEKPSVAKLFLPMMTCVSGLRIVVKKPGSYVKEIQADASIPTEYKQDLVDYIDNHVMANPETAHGIVVTDEEFNNEQLQGVEFTNYTIRMMKARRAALKGVLASQHKLQSSPYYKKLTKVVAHGIGKDVDKEITNLRELGRDHVIQEAFDRDYREAMKEASVIMESLKNVDNRDLALLQSNIDSMTTVDDKNYILNTIFDFLEVLELKKEEALKKAKPRGSRAEEELAKIAKPYDMKIDILNDMLKEVSARKVTYYGDHYGVFVKYPEGYEG